MSTVTIMLAATGIVFSMHGSSLLEDREFALGFRLSAIRSSMMPVEVGHVLQTDARQPPCWRLAQWGTRYSLESAPETASNDGTRTIANKNKTVTVYPGGFVGDGILLAMNSGVEYNGGLRPYGAAWPHLLIEQAITDAPLGKMSALAFNLTFHVERCVPTTEQELDPSLHTAHISAFWTIHNKNQACEDYNDMIWFGVPLYDVRYPVPHGHQALDTGQDDATGKFICTIEGARFYSEPVETGKWHTLDCDLLPLMREALEAAQARGFLSNTRFADLAITSFNLGWEMPGPYDCSILLRDLALEPAWLPEGVGPDVKQP